MPLPVIGITVDYNDHLTAYESPYAYAKAVEKAGGLPLLLPYRADVSLIPQYVDLIDGMLFSGGNDLDPQAWGETYHPKTVAIDPLREKFERALMAELEKRRTPTMGICLGSQLMNVYRGGSLNQFLPEMDRPGAIEHRRAGGDHCCGTQAKVFPADQSTRGHHRKRFRRRPRNSGKTGKSCQHQSQAIHADYRVSGFACIASRPMALSKPWKIRPCRCGLAFNGIRSGCMKSRSIWRCSSCWSKKRERTTDEHR